MSFSQSLRQLGQPIAYYPQLAKPLGGVTAAVLFGQLFYWQDKTDNPLGVYKTLDALMEETGLTERELRSAREKLRELGIVIETNKRLEHRLYFKVDFEAFDRLMEAYFAKRQNVIPPNDKTSFREQAKCHSVNTETTTKTTNNNTSLTRSINTPSKKSPKLSALALLEQFGITAQLAEDFIIHRKAKKAPITETALKNFQREADKAKIPITLAVEIAIYRGWTGFNASWNWRDDLPNPISAVSTPSFHEMNDSDAWFTPELEAQLADILEGQQ